MYPCRQAAYRVPLLAGGLEAAGFMLIDENSGGAPGGDETATARGCQHNSPER
jgi:hypothetical protein